MATDARQYDEQYRAAIEWERKRMNDRRFERNVGRIADEESPSFHVRIGAGYRRIAIYALLLGDRENTGEWFEKSAAHYLASVRERRARGAPVAEREAPELLTAAIYAAVLSHNWVLMGTVARTTREVRSVADDDYSATLRCGHERIGFLAALLTGRDTGAHLSALEAAIGDLSPEVRPYYEPYATAFRGLDAADASTVSRGLTEMLGRHGAGLNGKPKQPRELVCYPATALARLARDRGLAVAVDSEYLPNDDLA